MASPMESVVRTIPHEACPPGGQLIQRLLTLPWAVAARFSFPDPAEFIWRHEQATLIEMHNEERIAKRLNEARQPFMAWPIAPIPGLTTPFSKSWLFLVKTPGGGANDAFPCLTDRVTVNLDATVERPEGTFSLVNLPASRIQNPYENLPCFGGGEVSRCAAFKVDVPRSWESNNGTIVELDLMETFQTASSLHEIQSISASHENHQVITFQWEVSTLTFECELDALHRLANSHRLEEMGPSRRSVSVFRMIQDFANPGWVYDINLHEEFPQLQNPTRAKYRLPKLLVDKYKAFDEDHRVAFDGLRCVPNGLYFVNGCPGAGKTEWNMVLAALIQSKKSPKSRRRHTQPLLRSLQGGGLEASHHSNARLAL